MAIHHSVRRIISQFEAKELHAARSGREVMEALAAVVADSQAARLEDLAHDLNANVEALLTAMPAYAPPLNVVQQVYQRYEVALKRQGSVEELKEAIIEQAYTFREWAARARATIAAYGAAVIPEGGSIFTFTYSETVFRTLRDAWENGHRFRVLLTESRPNNDGRLTARALAEAGIEVQISIDGSIGELIPQADVMLVGAEGILADGSAICKAGTYPAALIAQKNKVPVYVLVDTLKLHSRSRYGHSVALDPLQSEDLYPAEAAHKAAVCGSLFDKTPPELITALITEKGLIHPNQVSSWLLEMPTSHAIADRFQPH